MLNYRKRVSAIAVAYLMIPGSFVIAQDIGGGGGPATLLPGTVTIGRVSPGYTTAQTPVTGSGTGTTGAVAGILPADAAKTNYLCGFSIRSNATAATTGNATVSGGISGTMSFTEQVPTNTTGIGLVEESFFPCIPASGVNVAFQATAVAAGSGGVTSVAIWGYKE